MAILFSRLAVCITILGAILAYFLMPRGGQDYVPPVQGRNQTVFFAINEENGFSNVHIATAYALLQLYPSLHIHVASFSRLKPQVDRIWAASKERADSVLPGPKIVFHNLPGPSYGDVLEVQQKRDVTDSIHPPGIKGLEQFVREIQMYLSPWSGPDHYEIYEALGRLIDEIDPAVVVLDSLFRPAIDITRDKNRLHAFIVPNTVVDNFASKQPWAGMLWKYPAIGSGIPFPIPWHSIPSNAYQVIRFIYAVVRTPDIAQKRLYLKDKGLANPIDFFGLHRPDVPWLTQTMPEASVPIDVMPANVTCCGPIVISIGSVAEQDPEMEAWLKRSKTVLINLGSSVRYDEKRARAMIGAIRVLLDRTDVQVLWKFRKVKVYDDSFKDEVKEYIANGRLRLESWLKADPVSILESGHVVAFVNHGGANCYHEAITAGVPQLLLPLWVDLYNYATLVESLGIGLWGCRSTAPDWHADCLSAAFLEIVDGKSTESRKEKATKLAAIARKNPGRNVAARVIAQLAGSGYA